MHLKAQKLEEELQRVKAEAEEQVQRAKDDAMKEKKKLEAELEAERTKVKDANELLKSVCEGKNGVYHDRRILISGNIVNIHWLIDANKKEKALQDDLKEAKDTIWILKESTKAANDSEYAMTQKLAYESESTETLRSTSSLPCNLYKMTKWPLQDLKWRLPTSRRPLNT